MKIIQKHHYQYFGKSLGRYQSW